MCLLLAYYGYLHIHMESNMIFEVIWVNLGCISEYSFNCKSCGAARVCIDIVVLYETFHLFLQSFIIHYYMNRTMSNLYLFITNLSTEYLCSTRRLGIHNKFEHTEHLCSIILPLYSSVSLNAYG